MNYDALTTEYWTAQSTRVDQLRQKIAERPTLGAGRVVPDDDALTIGSGKRLSMAVMFIDICSFSSRRMETIQEQDMTLRVLSLYFTEMIRIAEEYDGNVEKNTGDGLFIYFNDGEGTPPECGAKRAVACALSMFAATQNLVNPIIAASGSQPIDFRASIDYGMVTIARVGAPRRFNANVAIGAAANFASKMLKFAKLNEIVIGETAKNQLPADWQRHWTEPVVEPTGWAYVSNNSPYVLYRYTGRWAKLV